MSLPPLTEPAKTGKTFTWSTLLRDHTRFVTILPNYLAAYIIPSYALSPTTIEGGMLTVNSHNTYPYCAGLHGQLARMAGMGQEPDKFDPAVGYAKTFAIEAGRGSDVDASFDVLVCQIGTARAKSVQALCWALLWGKTTDNTINNARDNVFVLAYYGPLFLVISVLNKILKIIPGIPGYVSASLGAISWLPQAMNIVPLGIASIVMNFGVV